MPTEEVNGTNGNHAEMMDTEQQPIKEKTAGAKAVMKMTFNEYRRVSNLIVLHIQKLEESEWMIQKLMLYKREFISQEFEKTRLK